MADREAPRGMNIRNMKLSDLETAVDWAAAEGWNPGLADAPIFYSADPHGFLMAELDGRMAGSVSAVAYGDCYGFMGFYIVPEDLRGRGIGINLFRAGLDYLVGRVVGLDGVMAQQGNYRSMGFETAFVSVRQEGRAGGEDPGGTVALGPEHLKQVMAYDRTCFPGPRTAFLNGWLSAPGHRALGVMAGGRLAGYAVMRPCRVGHKIGPLFADNQDAAERLFSALKARAGEGPVYLDTPLNNPLAAALVKRNNLSGVFETARMYAGGAPDWADRKVFGITTFELG